MDEFDAGLVKAVEDALYPYGALASIALRAIRFANYEIVDRRRCNITGTICGTDEWQTEPGCFCVACKQWRSHDRPSAM